MKCDSTDTFYTTPIQQIYIYKQNGVVTKCMFN